MHETVTSPKSTDLSVWSRPRGDAGVVEGSYADDAKGVTPGQDRSFRVAVAYRGYAGDGWRVKPPGASLLPAPSRSRPDRILRIGRPTGGIQDFTVQGQHAASPLPSRCAEPRRSHKLALKPWETCV